MTHCFKPLLIAALIAGAAVTATAQSMGGPEGAPMGHHRMDPAKMQAMVAKREADLKARLKLSPAQEPAWNSFVASMQPPADMAQRMNPENRRKMREEMAALTTPERLNRMEAMKAQHDAEMAKRHAATRAFYAVLTPEQQKVFDAQTLHGGRREGHGKPGEHKS